MSKKTKLKLTNANIRLRYDAEAYENPDFTFSDMAKLFNIKEQTAWRWASDGKHSLLPTTRECHKCGHSSAKAVLKWLNDGKAMAHYIKFKGRLVAKKGVK